MLQIPANIIVVAHHKLKDSTVQLIVAFLASLHNTLREIYGKGKIQLNRGVKTFTHNRVKTVFDR